MGLTAKCDWCSKEVAAKIRHVDEHIILPRPWKYKTSPRPVRVPEEAEDGDELETLVACSDRCRELIQGARRDVKVLRRGRAHRERKRRRSG